MNAALTPVPGEIAFVSNASGRDQIYLMNSDGSDAHPLTRDDHDNRDPAWSPDGRQIAYTRSIDEPKETSSDTQSLYPAGGAEIIVMDPDGSTPIRLTSSLSAEGLSAFSPVWSPDGKSIAFEAVQTSLLGDPFAGWNIYIADAGGSGKIRQLTNWQAGTGVGCLGAEWLPDGRHLMVYCRSLMQAGVVLYDLEDPNNVETIFEGQDAHMYDASPLGAIALSEGSYILTMWGDDLSNTAMINDQLSHSPSSYAGITELAWSPEGADQLAVRAYDGLYVTNQDGSDVRELASSLPSTGIRPTMNWSADGSQIVFVATLDGNQELMLAALDQKGALRLTSSEARESQPAWRPGAAP